MLVAARSSERSSVDFKAVISPGKVGVEGVERIDDWSAGGAVASAAAMSRGASSAEELLFFLVLLLMGVDDLIFLFLLNGGGEGDAEAVKERCRRRWYRRLRQPCSKHSCRSDCRHGCRGVSPASLSARLFLLSLAAVVGHWGGELYDGGVLQVEAAVFILARSAAVNFSAEFLSVPPIMLFRGVPPFSDGIRALGSGEK